ncbi:myb-like domain, Myb/SANT-like DNA-binding domain protein [Artemisia annua]|uniref:Myb-like domain, Myb/SANT-like DNA-binding domain protein n=1 Tax=Artemisia annua TaxID=35608 RepID=A0A2U1NYN7_ARTAN|nr:myb-like domain, Myb/SANT-like DNA-binding domain protein [Artemisia annua]
MEPKKNRDPRKINQVARGRERESAPLPIRDDTDDDEYFDHVDMVPETQPFNEEAETQPINEEVEEVVVTPPKRKVNTNWSPEEEEALAKALIKISMDKHVGDRQTKQGFWKRVLKHYQSLMPRSQRTKDQLNSK